MASTDFTIADVLAWARTKPADAVYNYGDNDNCALCQFLKATARAEKPYVEPFIANICDGFWTEGETGDRVIYSPELEPALVGDDNTKAWTFGALVGRLEALIPAEPVSDTWTRADAYLAVTEQVPA